MRRLVAIGCLLATPLAACGGGDDAAPETTAADEEATTGDDDAADATIVEDDADAPATTESQAPESTEAPETTTTEPPAPQPLVAGFDELITTSVQPGQVDDRPIMTWSEVAGADHYGVYVYAPNGEIYWSWRGSALEVPVGGAIGDAPGPAVADGMTWAVIAYDDQLLPLAVSAVVPLSG